MTYATGGLIEASDFNNLVGSYAQPNLGSTINAIWGTGFSNSGYGQAQLPNVDQNEIISYQDWSDLINVMNTMAYFQETSITAYDPPQQDDKIEYLSKLISNKDKLYKYKNYARLQGSTSTFTQTVNNVWSDSAVFVQDIAFESADKARYFFNSGGQIAITFTHTNGSGINTMWHELAMDSGTIVLSGLQPDNSSVITGTTYEGVTKIGGSGTASINNNHSYYALTTNYVEIFRQRAFSVFSDYLQSYISVEIKSNGTQGVHGDRGSIITVRTTWNAVPNVSYNLVNDTTSVNIGVRYPFSTSVPIPNFPTPFYDTWGTVNVSGYSIAI